MNEKKTLPLGLKLSLVSNAILAKNCQEGLEVEVSEGATEPNGFALVLIEEGAVGRLGWERSCCAQENSVLTA